MSWHTHSVGRVLSFQLFVTDKPDSLTIRPDMRMETRPGIKEKINHFPKQAIQSINKPKFKWMGQKS